MSASTPDPTFVLDVYGAPADLLALLVRVGGIMKAKREGDDLYAIRTVPLSPVELAAVARELTTSNDVTAFVPVPDEPPVRSDNSGLFLGCPNHPGEWIGLYRDEDGILHCPALSCNYRTDDTGHRYANT